jgi:hypothetical protein
MDKMSDLNAQELGTNLVPVDINQYLNFEVVLRVTTLKTCGESSYGLAAPPRKTTALRQKQYLCNEYNKPGQCAQ